MLCNGYGHNIGMDGELRRGSCFDFMAVFGSCMDATYDVDFVGYLIREWERQCRMLLRPWHGAVSVLWMEIGN